MIGTTPCGLGYVHVGGRLELGNYPNLSSG